LLLAAHVGQQCGEKAVAAAEMMDQHAMAGVELGGKAPQGQVGDLVPPVQQFLPGT
jgi:hypothetical protein